MAHGRPDGADPSCAMAHMLWAVVCCLSIPAASGRALVSLDTSDLNGRVQHGDWFVKFFEPWCVYCQRLSPIWERLAERAVAEHWPVRVAEFDCTKEQLAKLRCQSLGVRAFPTLLLLHDGAVAGRYFGEASVTRLEQWLGLQHLSQSKPIADDEHSHSAQLGSRGASAAPSRPPHQSTSPPAHPSQPVSASRGGRDRTHRHITFAPGNHALVARILVGSPPQALRCLVYSGSSDFWVPSARCHSCDCEHHFVANKSSTFMPHMVRTTFGSRPKPVQVAYGSSTGSIAGFAVQDTVDFGSVKVENQSFIIVEEAAMPPHRTWDGLCGLGWGRSVDKDLPLYERVQRQGRRALFSLVPGAGGEAQMVVGEVPRSDLEESTLVWAKAEPYGRRAGLNVAQRSFWVTSGGLAVHKRTPVSAQFLVDTGTNMVLLTPRSQYVGFVRSLLPELVFERFCGRELAVEGFIVCRCSVVRERGLLPLRVYLGGRPFLIGIADLFVRLPAKHSDVELCLLLIQPNRMASFGGPSLAAGLIGGQLLPSGGVSTVAQQDPADDVWVLGGVFLERLVTIFDFDNGLIGFAQPAVGSVPPKQCISCWENSEVPSSRNLGSALRPWLVPASSIVGAVSAMLLGLFCWRLPRGAWRSGGNIGCLVESMEVGGARE